MPNWCNNSGSITLPENASPAARAAFHVLNHPNPDIGWMSNVLPSPPEMHLGIGSTQSDPKYCNLEWLKANSKFTGDFGTFSDTGTFTPSQEYLDYLNFEFGAANWYDWNVANYGTKWDVTPEVYDVSDNTIDFSCESAWSPIDEFMSYLASLGLKVRLSYDEDGMGFGGEFHNHTADGTFESSYFEGEDYIKWRVLDRGFDLEAYFHNLDEYETFEDYSEENELPSSEELVERIKTYYKDKNAE